MSPFFAGFIVGIIIGANLGLLVLALFTAAKREKE
jgi:gas vesicle protein